MKTLVAAAILVMAIASPALAQRAQSAPPFAFASRCKVLERVPPAATQAWRDVRAREGAVGKPLCSGGSGGDGVRQFHVGNCLPIPATVHRNHRSERL